MLLEVCQKHMTGFETQKPTCPADDVAIRTVFMHHEVWISYSHGTEFLKTLRTVFPVRVISRFGYNLPPPLPDAVPRSFHLAVPDY
jgi:hypothetical protein